jgi:hypothetical protein
MPSNYYKHARVPNVTAKLQSLHVIAIPTFLLQFEHLIAMPAPLLQFECLIATPSLVLSSKGFLFILLVITILPSIISDCNCAWNPGDVDQI